MYAGTAPRTSGQGPRPGSARSHVREPPSFRLSPSLHSTQSSHHWHRRRVQCEAHSACRGTPPDAIIPPRASAPSSQLPCRHGDWHSAGGRHSARRGHSAGTYPSALDRKAPHVRRIYFPSSRLLRHSARPDRSAGRGRPTSIGAEYLVSMPPWRLVSGSAVPVRRRTSSPHLSSVPSRQPPRLRGAWVSSSARRHCSRLSALPRRRGRPTCHRRHVEHLRPASLHD